MPSSNRKRFSAFEDFPAQPVEESTALPHPLPVQKEAPAVERIERLHPSQMRPDRFQPRRLLPTHIRDAFIHNKIDCYAAARQWLEMSKNDDSLKAEIDRLMAMGNSFDEHGQIKPITGSWISAPDGSYIFQIETGERRFWAACLQSVIQGMTEEPSLRVEVVSNPTRQRQVLENRHAEAPSAVEQACEVAALILAELGIAPDPVIKDDYDYFRQVRSQRMPTGLWDKVMPVMQLTRPRMVQLLNILQLPTPLLELASRSRLPERVLREALALPSTRWESVIRLSIQQQLTSDEVAQVTQSVETPAAPVIPSHPIPPEPARLARRNFHRFVRSLSELEEDMQAQVLDQLADDLVVNKQADGVVTIMGELSQRIAARKSRR